MGVVVDLRVTEHEETMRDNFEVKAARRHRWAVREDAAHESNPNPVGQSNQLTARLHRFAASQPTVEHVHTFSLRIFADNFTFNAKHASLQTPRDVSLPYLVTSSALCQISWRHELRHGQLCHASFCVPQGSSRNHPRQGLPLHAATDATCLVARSLVWNVRLHTGHRPLSLMQSAPICRRLCTVHS